MDKTEVDVSIIIPVYNGEKWIVKCFSSILSQTILQHVKVSVEVVVFNDGSTDRTIQVLESWREELTRHRINYIILSSGADSPRGVGAARNAAVKRSSGQYLCFQDIDDVMSPKRIQMQLEAAKQMPLSLIGAKFRRDPAGSTVRFTEWANNLELEKLRVQIYTSHGPTIIMPTWFCHRSVFERVGGFEEDAKGTPEDLIFFFKHLNLNGDIFRVDEELLIYTYHPNATTFSVLSETIWEIRIKHLEEHVLNNWSKLSIWNAGRQGRKLVRSLSPANQDKVVALCDVDLKKVGKTYQLYCNSRKQFIRTYPIIHFREAKPPIVICVKLGLSNGEFEANLKSMNLKEGSEYVIFS